MPLVTEKTIKEAASSKYTFKVDKNMDKGQITDILQNLYQVKVRSIQTAKVPGKSRRFGRRSKSFKYSDQKKACVQLEKGQKIDLFEAPESPKEEKPKTKS
jgi:large subunit ribosomal protein L23